MSIVSLIILAALWNTEDAVTGVLGGGARVSSLCGKQKSWQEKGLLPCYRCSAPGTTKGFPHRLPPSRGRYAGREPHVASPVKTTLAKVAERASGLQTEPGV